MTYEEARRQADQLKAACPDLFVLVQVRDDGTRAVIAVEPNAQPITLPDALSVRAYLDARRGYRTEAGAPDFGPGGV